jgi:pyruvate formate lyase activating enzyme
MIHSSSKFISGVVFSGGEPTMQKEGLITLAEYAQKLNLAVGIQTNGFFPQTLDALLSNDLVNKIAIDYKTTWEGFSGIPGGYCTPVKENYEKTVLASIEICKKAYEKKKLDEFEVVFTIFYENQEYIMEISRKIGDVPLVLQQGEHKIAVMSDASSEITQGEYIWRKRIQQERHPPLTFDEIKEIAGKLERTLRIRTREMGEVTYEGRRRRRAPRKR